MDTTSVLNGYTAPDLAQIAAGDGRGAWTVTRATSDRGALRCLSLERGEGDDRQFLSIATAGSRVEVLARSKGQAEVLRTHWHEQGAPSWTHGTTTPALSELEERWLDPSEGPAFESACLVVEALAWGAVARV